MKDHVEPDPDCPWCLGEGVVDSGGFTPWGEGIDVRCSCTYPCDCCKSSPCRCDEIYESHRDRKLERDLNG